MVLGFVGNAKRQNLNIIIIRWKVVRKGLLGFLYMGFRNKGYDKFTVLIEKYRTLHIR